MNKTTLLLIIADDDNHLLRDSETHQEHEDKRTRAMQAIHELSKQEVAGLSEPSRKLYSKLTGLTMYQYAKLEGTL